MKSFNQFMEEKTNSKESILSYPSSFTEMRPKAKDKDETNPNWLSWESSFAEIRDKAR